MFRVPEEIVRHARTVAVDTPNYRVYVVGGLAQYAAIDYGPKRDRTALVVLHAAADEPDLVTEYCPFVPVAVSDCTTTRTRFGGLRYLLTHPDAPVGSVDVWRHETLAEYLNAQDKGEGFVIDPVTMRSWRAYYSGDEHLYIKVGKAVVPVTFTSRDAGGDLESEVARFGYVNDKLAPGNNVLQLLDGDRKTVLREWEVEGPEKPAPVWYSVRRYGDYDLADRFTVFEAAPDADDKTIRKLADPILEDIGRAPGRHPLMVFRGKFPSLTFDRMVVPA